jgi:Cu/Ag efflux protein CusF
MSKALGERLKLGLKHDSTPFLIALLVFALSCQAPAPPEKLLGRGVVQKVVPVDRRVVIAHDDIPGFMHAMTMSFEVRNPALLEKFTPGEHVRFTLEKTDQTLYLVGVESEEAVGGPPTAPPERSASHE